MSLTRSSATAATSHESQSLDPTEVQPDTLSLLALAPSPAVAMESNHAASSLPLPRILPPRGNGLWFRLVNVIQALRDGNFGLNQVSQLFPSLMGILKDMVLQLEISQSNELALQAQIDALIVDQQRLQEQLQRLTEVIAALTETPKLRHLLQQGPTSS